MKSDRHDYDVIVVGAGMAGLATAAFLARAGRRVGLFDQSHAVGGRAQTKMQDGFYLNIGPHALYRGGRGIEVLRELGIEPRGRVPSVSGAFAVRDGRKHTFPAGAVSLLTTSLFGLSAKLEAGRVLAAIGRIDGSRLMHLSVRDWVDQQVSHPEVRDLILAAFRVATYTNAPGLMSAGTALEQLKKAQDKSVLYLDGGWQSLVDGLRNIALESGVAIETEARVESVMLGPGGAVTGVRLAGGREHHAGLVAVAASPAIAAGLVEGPAKAPLERWAEQAIPVKAACLDVALNNLPVPNATFALGMDRPLYLSVHSAAARLAPEGCALIQVAKYLPPEHSDTPEEVERELEGLLDLIQPGWRGSLAYRRFLPDLTVINALPLAARGGAAGRPGPEVPEVPGLFVAGDWVGREGLLVDASLASAREAARLMSARSVSTNAAVV